MPSDYNIATKEKEKVEKYQPLREEIEKCWKIKTTVIPIVIGALGAITPAHQSWAAQLPAAPERYLSVAEICTVRNGQDPEASAQTPCSLVGDPRLRICIWFESLDRPLQRRRGDLWKKKG